MKLVYTLLIAFCCAWSAAIAQSNDVPDSVLVPKSLLKNVLFTYLDLVDSFSKAGDTINASRYFLQISPYYFMYDGTKPGSIDTLFSRFALTIQAKDSFRTIFTDTFLAPHSAVYKKLQAMYAEDQAIRMSLMNCADSFTCATLETKMMKATASTLNTCTAM